MLVDERNRLRTSITLLAVVALLPGVTGAQPVDPTVITDVSTPVRAVGSFVLVLLFGGTFLALGEGFVDGSVDASMESPLRSVAYGAFAQISLVLLGAYAVSQLASIGSGRPIVATVGLLIVSLGWLALACFGFTVVGAALTDAAGDRQLWSGVAIGAAIAAFAWVLPTVLLGVLASIAVVSVGVGGLTRRWLHASIEGDAEAEADA